MNASTVRVGVVAVVLAFALTGHWALKAGDTGPEAVRTDTAECSTLTVAQEQYVPMAILVNGSRIGRVLGHEVISTFDLCGLSEVRYVSVLYNEFMGFNVWPDETFKLDSPVQLEIYIGADEKGSGWAK